MERSPVRYVTIDDSDIAYQVAGNGTRDVLWLYALGGQIDLVWQLPRFTESLEGLGSFARVLLLDRRGSGASDAMPDSNVSHWELFTEDIGAVLDATGSESVSLIGFRETGQIAMLYAAIHPERVSSLILLNTTARYLEAEDHPGGESSATVDTLVEVIRNSWGVADLGRVTSPSLADNPDALQTIAMLQRASATPHQAARQYESFLRHNDVRHVLGSIQVPTLVLHVAESPLLPVAHGRFLADHIPGARFVELPGGDLGGGLAAGAVEEIAEFITGARPAEPVDRVLTTVLFTDIVTSTELVSRLGDRRWHETLNAHDRLMREQLQRFRGREVNTTGDGFVASFDGPGRAILCARAMRDAARGLGLELHLGLHTGECEVRGADLAGITVHLAARVCAHADAGVITVSRTVADLVAGSGFDFDDLGEHVLKGIPGTWKLLGVRD